MSIMTQVQGQICLVENDPSIGGMISEHLCQQGFQVDCCTNVNTALIKLLNQNYDVLIYDTCLTDLQGKQLLYELKNSNKAIPKTLLITTRDSEQEAIKLLQFGAYDYIFKPLDLDELTDKLPNSFKNLKSKDNFTFNSTCSPIMQEIEKSITSLADYPDTPVLLTGESGVGKEEIAKQLHQTTSTDKPFVAVNCSAIPENLIESELFGHEKGAFTGASKIHKGVFEQANGGTLFLDEIGDMPVLAQVKLLRVLQDYKITRVGSETNIPVQLRIICATHQNLKELVSKSLFREDLYYRINVIQLHIPALRERKEDILLLTEYFLGCHAKNYPAKCKFISKSAQDALIDYPWPGNIRELKHTIERACILSDSNMINYNDLLFDSPLLIYSPSKNKLKEFLKDVEREKIYDILLKNGWKISDTAKELGICRKVLWEKMRKHDIHKQ